MAGKREREWFRWNLWMTKAQKDRLEEAARELEVSQASIVREALDLHLKDVMAAHERIVAASELAIRQRRERMDLGPAKDTHKTGLKPAQAWQAIKKEWAIYGDDEALTVLDFDDWIRMLEENKQSIDQDNPGRARVMEKYDIYIGRLKEERKRYE